MNAAPGNHLPIPFMQIETGVWDGYQWRLDNHLLVELVAGCMAVA